MQPLWGQMLEDWVRQILTAVRYGLQQDGSADEQFYQRMEDGLWQCTNAQELLRLLQDGVSGELNRLRRERSQREARPINGRKALYPAALSGISAARGRQQCGRLQRDLLFRHVQKGDRTEFHGLSDRAAHE